MSALTRRHLLRLLPAAALCSCGDEPASSGAPMPKVKWLTTSTTPFTANMVAVIGGDAVDSRCFLPQGVSPYGFAPGAPDLAKFDTSDIVFAHGLGLENKWAVDFAALDKSGVRVFTVTDTIPPDRIIRPSGPGGPPDPHVWTDPALAALMVDAVEAALKTAIPKLADYFTPRAYSLRLQFQDAVAYNTEKLRALQPKDRFLLSTHDTLQYLAKACGLEAKALSPANGTVPEALTDELSTWIRSHGVRSLFRERSTEILPLRKLLRELSVDPDHVIYSLALGAPEAFESVSIRNYNVDTAAGAIRYTCDSIIATLEVD